MSTPTLTDAQTDLVRDYIEAHNYAQAFGRVEDADGQTVSESGGYAGFYAAHRDDIEAWDADRRAEDEEAEQLVEQLRDTATPSSPPTPTPSSSAPSTATTWWPPCAGASCPASRPPAARSSTQPRTRSDRAAIAIRPA